jgi:hypothetical protein
MAESEKTGPGRVSRMGFRLWERFLQVPGRRKIAAGLSLVIFGSAGLYLSPQVGSDVGATDRPALLAANAPPLPPPRSPPPSSSSSA